MKKLILHIGRHKSGTSTLQSTLAGNRDLLREHGFHYPDTGRRENAHHLLSEPLTRGRLGGRDHRPVWAGLREALDRELADVRERVIISSEAFQNGDPGVLKSAFEGFDARVVVYLREQGSYLLSAYAQKVRASDYAETIDTFYRQGFAADYERFLTSWSARFDGAMDVRLFDRSRLRGQDVVVDFCTGVLGMPARDVESLRTAGDVNSGLSARMLAYKLMVNRTVGVPEEFRIAFFRLLATLSNGDGSGGATLSASLAERVASDHRASNAAVAMRHFGRNDLFGPARARVGEDYRLSADEAKAIGEQVIECLPGMASRLGKLRFDAHAAASRER